MPDDANKPINPFLAAKRASGVHVSMETRDVLWIRPDWSEQQAAAFMDRHAAIIANAMLKAGTDVLIRLMEDA